MRVREMEVRQGVFSVHCMITTGKGDRRQVWGEIGGWEHLVWLGGRAGWRGVRPIGVLGPGRGRRDDGLGKE